MAQVYGCDAANGLWVVPGSHHGGKHDIAAMVAAAGSDRLPAAVPLICGPGDVAITNRQTIHGSFANTSDNPRVTLNMGFHRRRSVLGVRSGGVHNPVALFDDAYIRHRSRLIMYGIAARRQRYPDEPSYTYQPLADAAADYQWSDAARADIRDYNLNDMGI
jgi:ectoine hydroxylase-related dioxygenase (phytanoyl-CoA dioxygenase family)